MSAAKMVRVVDVRRIIPPLLVGNDNVRLYGGAPVFLWASLLSQSKGVPRELGPFFLRYRTSWISWLSWALCHSHSLLPTLVVFSFNVRLEVPCLILSLILAILAFSGQAHAFGAGNIASISRIEAQNWRHGDIEDALLTLLVARVAGGRKFNKFDVQRVYFGNWLRDYSQAVDVGILKYVSAEAIRILIWVLGFLIFGQATEFPHYASAGCYEPTEHIDNPLGYAEGEDAQDYDHRLRGPVDEERELSVDSMTGLVRRAFCRSIQLGRQYAKSRNDEDLHEAFRLLGTGLHCLEDYAAHSNYTVLSLIEMDESEILPHVGRNTKVELHSAQKDVYPVVTGTFGGVDVSHSVLGELSDKVTRSEVQFLEGVITDSQSGSPESFVQDLLSMIPAGLVDDSEAQANKMEEFKTQSENAKQYSQDVSPREPEEWTCYLEGVHQKIYPVLEWHDEIIKSINTAIEKIPVLPELVEQIQDHITVFVFSVLAPYVLPIIKQVKVELQTGSSEVIQSSREQQHIVFGNDESSNPTHSMLSKDHFSNVLNEPAGALASKIIKWTVPQLMECWDSEDIDITRTLDRIIVGVFHHPALREYGEDGAADVRQIMFHTVEEWWHGKTEEEQEYLREHSLEEAAAEAAGDGTLRGLVSGLVSSVGSMLLKDPESHSPDGTVMVDRYDTHGRLNNRGEQHQYEYQEPYDEEASLEEQRPPWNVRHENYDKGELWRDRWNYEHESVECLEHQNETSMIITCPRWVVTARLLGITRRRPTDPDLMSIAMAMEKIAMVTTTALYAMSLVMILLVHIMLDSRPQYADAERQGYENDKP
ncbi:heterokaryon incompatibility protein Het-C-domain-containing protein [Aspergillus arachidicola]|uniref:Heterokaryon incompatibility protein Het-C-domain-containing protein n=1 Tax=Aspergillus arachidicola TaxID=656916 RepID=A0A5N6Y0Y8_9EURO|nr:heterokaryon incompatibility protein Het-C-domain-containing protein [Aspergillus arachidicola]